MATVLMTLDLKKADDYRRDLYNELKGSDWKKRDKADTTWTAKIHISSTSPATSVKDALKKPFSVLQGKEAKLTGYIHTGSQGIFEIDYNGTRTTKLNVSKL